MSFENRKSDPTVAFPRNGFLLFGREEVSMSKPHRLDRLFSTRTKERLEFYFLLLQVFSAILLILDLLSRA